MFRRNLSLGSEIDIEGAAGGNCMGCAVEVPRPGNYRLAVTIRAKDSGPLGKVEISTGRGRLAFVGEVSHETFEHVTVVNVGDHVPEGWSLVCEDRNLSVTVTAEGAFAGEISVREVSCPTIYIAETVKAQDMAEGGEEPDALRGGWSRMLAAYACDRISVSSHFSKGLTPESFRRKGLYGMISRYGRPGDFYFFQFGFSGEDRGEPAAGADYKRQLARYVLECRERLAYPVLLAPIPLSGTEKGAVREYTEACREVGQMLEIPVIEPQCAGVSKHSAFAAAGAVAEEIVKVCSGFPERRYRFLAKCLTKKAG